MSKQDILIENGTFNKNHERVIEPRFITDDFYDPHDLAQVKYEMLRTSRESTDNIEEISFRFGFSRASFYKIKKSYEEEGISAFISNKSGPQSAWKLTHEHKCFIDAYLKENPGASSADIVSILKEQTGLEISKRTIERYRTPKKEK